MELDGARALSIESAFPLIPHMRLLRKVFWILAFLAATFCWMVLFQHGFSLPAFQKGAAEEWARLTQMVAAAAPASSQP
jgi:hypothetical protein